MNLTQKDTTLNLIAEMSRKHERIDAMSLARKYNQTTGEHLDWHEFSYYLDSLYNRQFLKIVNPGGWVAYDLNG